MMRLKEETFTARNLKHQNLLLSFKESPQRKENSTTDHQTRSSSLEEKHLRKKRPWLTNTFRAEVARLISIKLEPYSIICMLIL